MLLVFLTPRQALSYPLLFIMILWESMNFHPDKQLFQVAGAGDRTDDPWFTSPTLPPTPRGTTLFQRLSAIFTLKKQSLCIEIRSQNTSGAILSAEKVQIL